MKLLRLRLGRPGVGANGDHLSVRNRSLKILSTGTPTNRTAQVASKPCQSQCFKLRGHLV